MNVLCLFRCVYSKITCYASVFPVHHLYVHYNANSCCTSPASYDHDRVCFYMRYRGIYLFSLSIPASALHQQLAHRQHHTPTAFRVSLLIPAGLTAPHLLKPALCDRKHSTTHYTSRLLHTQSHDKNVQFDWTKFWEFLSPEWLWLLLAVSVSHCYTSCYQHQLLHVLLSEDIHMYDKYMYMFTSTCIIHVQ